ncbi:MAG TPA: alpha/beta fold hydrolase [Puia sp.]|nr:alpha/beta fold hydrolase [Puia sp.]
MIRQKKLAAIFLFSLFLSPFFMYAQELKLQDIMKGDRWTGVSPENIHWSPDSRTIYYDWNPDLKNSNIVYKVTTGDLRPVSTDSAAATRNTMIPGRAREVYSADRSKILTETYGDIVLNDWSRNERKYITHTLERESNPMFVLHDSMIVYQSGDNLFCTPLNGGDLVQLTNLVRPGEADGVKPNEYDILYQQKQLRNFSTLRSREEATAQLRRSQRKISSSYPRAFVLEKGSRLSNATVSPDLRFIIFTIQKPVENRSVIVADYVTRSGFTDPVAVPNRTKAGSYSPESKSYIYDRQRDSIYPVAISMIPGIKDLPAYLGDYPSLQAKMRKEDKDRNLTITDLVWNGNGSHLAVNIVAADHKDRWIMLLDPLTGGLSEIDRQHDEAWVAGPGINRGVSLGWINEDLLYFQSEATGYSHIYTMDVKGNTRKQLTSGKYEVQSLLLSKDRRFFYFTANKKNPGIYHFYKLPVSGGEPEQLTAMDGENEASLSPDEKWIAIRYSYINQPWELYLQENKAGAKARQVTHSTTAAFNAYKWKIPETVSFTDSSGADVYAHVYVPAKPDPNRPAIVFVHSNGYLQNVHYGWSYHYREYMFNNLLLDAGYTIINVDYAGSSGYGRDFRTGIYRYMGGRDLESLVDGVRLLVQKYHVNPDRVGLYGGSYGGFLTLMAMFTRSNVFAAGAALRAVNDWSNYNQRYTTEILNDPLYDTISYRRSSPLFFADGLKGHLLMTHGVIDMNVNFQDAVLTSQRLIELEKDNWEMAIYPLEDHDFADANAWLDQYKRILRLFNDNLKK